jgi:hypothetical protein
VASQAEKREINLIGDVEGGGGNKN